MNPLAHDWLGASALDSDKRPICFWCHRRFTQQYVADYPLCPNLEFRKKFSRKWRRGYA